MNDLIKEADYILTDPDFNIQPNAASLIRKLRDELKKYQWRPIEEAPKDGTVILATNGYMTWTVVWTSYDAIRQDYGIKI